jgi:hypothetical protein
MIKSVITGVNDNFHYLKYTKLFKSAWKYFFKDITLYCCYTGNNLEIRNFLNNEFDHVFEIPFENFKESIYASQSARAYCASLVKEKGLCITTDIDLIPLNKDYFNKGAENSNIKEFLIYRNVLQDVQQIAISYCAAFPSTWEEITRVRSLSEAVEKIKNDYLKIQPDGIKGGEGWFYDQLNLYNLVIRDQRRWDPNTERLKVLDDKELKFSRLDRSLPNSKEIFFNNPLDLLSRYYSDYHLPEIDLQDIQEWEGKFIKNNEAKNINYFSLDFSKRLDSCLNKMKASKNDWRILFTLSKLRDEFACYCLDQNNNIQDIADHEGLLNIFVVFINTQVNYLNSKLNVVFRNYWLSEVQTEFTNISNQIQLLFTKPYHLKKLNHIQIFNNKFQSAYNRYLFLPPIFFEEINERNLYLNYFKKLLSELIDIAIPSKLEIFQTLVIDFLNTVSIIPLYFSDSALIEIMRLRASLIEIIVSSMAINSNLDYSFVQQSTGKLKIGILAAHFKEQTETYATLPCYEYLNKDKFQITLISQLPFTNSPIEIKCLDSASNYMTLSGNLADDIRHIREENFDILWIGTNITAVLNYITQISAFRLAKHQIVSGCCPVTSGFKNIDYFVSGTITETMNAQNDYTEKLLLLKGTTHCFSFEKNNVNFNKSNSDLRKEFHIPPESIIFASGANFYKLTPELLDTW